MVLIDFQKTQIFVKNKKDSPNAIFTLFPGHNPRLKTPHICRESSVRGKGAPYAATVTVLLTVLIRLFSSLSPEQYLVRIMIL